MMTYKKTLCLLCTSLLAIPSASPARDYGNVAGWQLASSGKSCGLYSSRAGYGEIIFLRNLAGDFHIHISNKNWKIDDGKKVSFAIDGKKWTGRFGISPHGTKNRPGYIAAFAPTIISQLRAGRRLAVERDNIPLVSFSLTGTAAAFNRLEFCLRELRRYGPAPVQSGAPAAKPPSITPARPTSGVGQWFNLSDYPKKAQREGREGTVKFRLAVNVKGRVTNCQVTGSSGHRDIDESTCKAAQKRARFTAAKRSDGTKIVGSYDGQVTWRVPK